MDSKPQTEDELGRGLAAFGLSGFRPAQQEIIEAVLSRKDVLCVMPTGSGKSLCYQLPAILDEGITLVVSPLIALMKDQVDSLRQLGIAAEFINSSLTTQQQAECLNRVDRGECRLLYVAPERFRSRQFIEIVRGLSLRLFAVDEAHCISEWGHDFRHDYARLGDFRARLGNPPTIALTATATPDVQVDIVKQLNLPDPQIFVAGFKRDNLFYSVRTCSTKSDKQESLIRFLRAHDGAGIVYVSTRAACSEVAGQLNKNIGRKVDIYHGKLESDQRRQVQDDFMSGRTPVIVATNAFGMGIDKPDVRFVVHYNMPGTIESYYQESGRAGRDGLPSHCLLLFSWQDRYIQEFFIDSAYPAADVVERVYEYLRFQTADPIEMTQSELKESLRLEISNEGVGTCERLLEKAGAIERLDPMRNMAVFRINSKLPSLVDLLPKQARQQRKLLAAIESIVGEARFETVYAPPSRVAKLADMPLNSINRLLRDLAELDAFDYFPPFRGRAIRVRNKQTGFEQLELDFETLAKHKKADLKKLEAMVGYGQANVCRQRVVLDYFGDRTADLCGQCDNCSDSRPLQHNVDPSMSGELHPAVRKAIRVALSGVARAKGKFGKSLVAAMLAGSQSTKIVRWKLDRLSTFGMLGYLTQTEIVKLLDALVRANLIQQNEVDRFRPVIELTGLGINAMKRDDGEINVILDARVLAKIRGAGFEAARPEPKSADDEAQPVPDEAQRASPSRSMARRNGMSIHRIR